MKKKGPYTFSLLRLGGVVYLDMIEQFLIPQLDADAQEGHIQFQCASTSTPVSQVGGLVERRR
jgi:hypothetical protein